jgi:hypothetical protein
MLSVDKGYRKRGIGVYCLLTIPSPPSPLTTSNPDSIRIGPPFYQCHAGQWVTGGKPPRPRHVVSPKP